MIKYTTQLNCEEHLHGFNNEIIDMDLNKLQHNYIGKREAGEMYVGGGYG